MGIGGFSENTEDRIQWLIFEAMASKCGGGEYNDENGKYSGNSQPYNIVLLYDENNVVLGYYVIDMAKEAHAPQIKLQKVNTSRSKN